MDLSNNTNTINEPSPLVDSSNIQDVNKNSTSSLKEGEIEGFLNNIFNQSNIILLIWFLAIYFIAYFILGFVINKGEVPNQQSQVSRMLDIIIFTCIILFIISSYYSYSEEKKQSILSDSVSFMDYFVNEPSSIVSVSLFLFLFYSVSYLFRIPMTSESKPLVVSMVENMAWILFLIIVFVDFFKYILGISITDMIHALFYTEVVPEKQLDLSGVQMDEVFNVSNNLYTYEDAQAICTSYGAKLATYDQIEQSYNTGAEWCNYGWSDGQMAYFPTQKATWEKLQQTKKHKNDCGRPGVNGGYFANPYLKFGVNCYGKKPKPNGDDLSRMHAKQNVVYPKSPEDIELENKVKYWKDNADKLLKVNSYNTNKWFQNNM